jgi:hypothetical protein
MAAEGEGSWFDVGLDLAALASFGAGKALSKGLEGALDATRGGDKAVNPWSGSYRGFKDKSKIALGWLE